MVSGYPLHPEEEKYIREHREDYPSITARALGNYYSHLNGGSRTTQTVRDYLKKLRDQEKMETPPSRIPETTLSTGPLVTLCVEPDPPPEKKKEPKKKKAAPTQKKKKEIPEDARAAPATG